MQARTVVASISLYLAIAGVASPAQALNGGHVIRKLSFIDGRAAKNANETHALAPGWAAGQPTPFLVALQLEAAALESSNVSSLCVALVSDFINVLQEAESTPGHVAVAPWKMTARLVEDGGELGGAGGNGEDEEGLILLCGGGDGAAWQPLVAAVGGKRAAGVVAVVGVELELELEEEQRGANRTQALQQEFWRLLLNVEAAPSGGSAWQRFEAQHGPLRVLDAAVASAPRGEAAAQQPAPFDPIGAPSTAYFQLLLQELDISAIGNAAARARFELDFMHIIRVNAASANLDIRILDIAPGSVAVSAGVMFLDGAPQAYWQARDFARRLGKYPEKTHFFGCRDFVASYGRSRVTFVKLLHVPSKYTAGTRTGNSSSHVNAIPAWLIMLMCLAVALTGLLLSVHYILDWRKLRAPDLLHYEPLLRPQLRQPSRGVPASR